MKNERKLSFGNFERLLLRGYKREVSISFAKLSKSKLTFFILARKTLKISFLTKSRRNFFGIEFQNVDFGRNSRQNEKNSFFQIVDFGRFSRQNELLKCCLRQQFNINFTIFSKPPFETLLFSSDTLVSKLFRSEVMLVLKIYRALLKV